MLLHVPPALASRSPPPTHPHPPPRPTMQASVTRLLASGTSDPLSAKTGISLGGISYGNGGVINGKEAVEQISTDRVDGNIRITLQMPAGSAALVRLPKQ